MLAKKRKDQIPSTHFDDRFYNPDKLYEQALGTQTTRFDESALQTSLLQRAL